MNAAADTTTPAKPDYADGSWQDTLSKSAALFERSGKARTRASAMLWEGAQVAINDWMDGGSDSDVHGEVLYADVMDVLGKPRKGDASKVKTVALAVKNNGLVLSVYPNLSKAYAEAVRLTKTKQAQADEDDAADKAVQALAENVPHSTTTVDGAALILLGKGIDGAVVAILDALGANNEAAHRAFMRAVSTEIAARVQAAKPKPQPKAPAKAKGAAQVAGKQGSKATAQVNTAGSKPKASKGTKAKPVATSASKGDPNKRALPVQKAKPVQPEPKGEPVTEPVEAGTEPVGTPEVAVKKAAKARPVVVKR